MERVERQTDAWAQIRGVALAIIAIAIGYKTPDAIWAVNARWEKAKRSYVLEYISKDLAGRDLEVDLKKGVKLEVKDMSDTEKEMAIYACTVRQDQMSSVIRGIFEMARP